MSKPRPVHPSFDRDPSWSISGPAKKKITGCLISLALNNDFDMQRASGGKVVRLSAGSLLRPSACFLHWPDRSKVVHHQRSCFGRSHRADEQDPSVLQKLQNADHHTASNIAKDALIDAYSLTFDWPMNGMKSEDSTTAGSGGFLASRGSSRRCVIWIDDRTVIFNWRSSV